MHIFRQHQILLLYNIWCHVLSVVTYLFKLKTKDVNSNIVNKHVKIYSKLIKYLTYILS